MSSGSYSPPYSPDTPPSPSSSTRELEKLEALDLSSFSTSPFSIVSRVIEEGPLKSQLEVIVTRKTGTDGLLLYTELLVETSSFCVLEAVNPEAEEKALFKKEEGLYHLLYNMVQVHTGSTFPEKAIQASAHYKKNGFLASITSEESDKKALHACFLQKKILKSDTSMDDLVYLYDMMRSNSFGSPSAGYIAFFSGHAVRINHSCDPNCEFYFTHDQKDPAQIQMHVFARRSISVGEALTFSYFPILPFYNTKKQRRDFLMRAMEFECQCSRCQGADEEPEHATPLFDLLGSSSTAFISMYKRLGAVNAFRAKAQAETDPVLSLQHLDSSLQELVSLWLDVLGSKTTVGDWNSLNLKHIRGSRLLWSYVTQHLLTVPWTKRRRAHYETLFPVLKQRDRIVAYFTKVLPLLNLNTINDIAFLAWIFDALDSSSDTFTKMVPFLTPFLSLSGNGYRKQDMVRTLTLLSNLCETRGLGNEPSLVYCEKLGDRMKGIILDLHLN